MKARVFISGKDGILDPEGVTVERALSSMGYSGISSVRVGKFIEIELDGSKTQAEGKVDEICRTILANPVIEQYSFEISSE